MKRVYCSYCGEPLVNGCDCEYEIAEAKRTEMENYEESGTVYEGERQQDLIDMYRRER